MNVLTGIIQSMRELEKRIQRLEAHSAPRLIMLATPLGSLSWDGNSFSDVSTSTQLDLSAVFGVPAGVKAVLIETRARDSVTYPTDGLYFACGQSSSRWYTHVVRPRGGDYIESEGPHLVPCDTNGDLWYRINASGVDTMDIWITIHGYLI